VGPYAWRPEWRYFPLPAVADLSVDAAVAQAAEVFDKTGVSNAGQLRTRIFAEHFAPGR